MADDEEDNKGVVVVVVLDIVGKALLEEEVFLPILSDKAERRRLMAGGDNEAKRGDDDSSSRWLAVEAIIVVALEPLVANVDVEAECGTILAKSILSSTEEDGVECDDDIQLLLPKFTLKRRSPPIAIEDLTTCGVDLMLLLARLSKEDEVVVEE